MKSRKNIIWAILLLLICVTLLVRERSVIKTAEVSSSNLTSCTGIQRSNVAKIISHSYYNQKDMEKLEESVKVEDSLPSFWYDKYIGPVIQTEYMDIKDKKFYPNDYLTYEDATNIFRKISKEKYNIAIRSEEENKDTNISMSKFLKVYTGLLEKLADDGSIENSHGLITRDIIVFATAATDEELEPWKVSTDKGEFGFEGLVLDGYIDKKIKVLMKNKEILGILNVADNNPVIESAYVTNMDKESVSVLVGGISKTYPSNITDKDFLDKLVDIKFKNGKIISIDIKEEEYRDKILRVGEDFIETERDGVLQVEDDLKIYDTSSDGANWSKLANIIVGTPDAEYHMEGKKISSITISQKPSIDSIRILLGTTDFTDIVHKDIDITCDTAFQVDFYGDIKSYKEGETLNIKRWARKMTKDKPRIKIIPEENGKVQINNIQRRGESPRYKGVIEVCKEEEGGYTIVNDVSIEDYVIGVIPSEMPTSYGIEACKVQAITSRSYAYVHSRNNKFGAYGANLDDSTSSQVYNNVASNDSVEIAVKETKDQILKYNDIPISANCFSTSSGYSANYGEVWANSDGTFPANTPVYLRSKRQFEKDLNQDMENEEIAAKFFKIPGANLDTYDSSSPWFRWKVTMSSKELTNSVNSAIKQRYNEAPNLIKTLGEDRVFRSQEISDVGKVRKFQVHKRGEGGNVMELIIYGSKEVIKVGAEYNIRKVLAPVQKIPNADDIIIKRQDATEIKNFEMLPSSFFTIDPTYDQNKYLKSATIYGGGFGHGVGMSQDGVKGMVEKGYTHLKILNHYFPETTVGTASY